MNKELKSYILKKREAGLPDDKIREKLVSSGWDAGMVDSALKADLDDDVPPPPPPEAQLHSVKPVNSTQPIAVINVSTTRGIEYLIMFIGLWISATAIGFLLHSAIDTLSGKPGYATEIAPFAGSALIVALPIFLVLFLRLKKAELGDSSVRSDPSRKRAIQLTLLVTFLIGIFKVIGYVFSLLNGGEGGGGGLFGGGSDIVTSPVFDFLHTVVTLGIAGGIFVYYWMDIHKKDA